MPRPRRSHHFLTTRITQPQPMVPPAGCSNGDIWSGRFWNHDIPCSNFTPATCTSTYRYDTLLFRAHPAESKGTAKIWGWVSMTARMELKNFALTCIYFISTTNPAHVDWHRTLYVLLDGWLSMLRSFMLSQGLRGCGSVGKDKLRHRA